MSADTMHDNGNTTTLGEIAEIKAIKLQESRAGDLLVTAKFHAAWSGVAGSENTDATFLSGLLDDCPRSLDRLTPNDSPSNDLPRQHLDIFGPEPQDGDTAGNAEGNSGAERKPSGHGSLSIVGRLHDFLLREVWVVRLREERKGRFLSAYVQHQVEENLPRVLDISRPKVTFDPGCTIPNKPNPPTKAELGACPIKNVSLCEQVNLDGSGFTTIEDALNRLVRPFYQGIDGILKLLASNTIQVGELLKQCRAVAALPLLLPGQSSWVFVQGLCRCVKSLAKASEGLKESPGKAAMQLIAAHEGLERFLIEHGPWWEKQSPLTLFERIAVARLTLALPGRGNMLATIDAHEKQREAQNRAEEKERIMGILSHNIKGLLASAVIEPLMLMQQRGTGDNAIIDEALRGARLLRDMVNAINLGRTGTKADFLADLRTPDEKALTLKTILYSSLHAAFANMLDGKYFSKYYSVHFPKAERYYEARKELVGLPPGDIQALVGFSRRFLQTQTQWDYPPNIAELRVGNSHNSALKLLVLFQELFLNAVKKATFVESEKRFLSVVVKSDESRISFDISNSYNPVDTQADTRLGMGIVNDLLRQLGAGETTKTLEDGIFSIHFALDCDATT